MHKYTFIWKTAKFLDFGIHPHLDKPPLHAPALTKPGESSRVCSLVPDKGTAIFVLIFKVNQELQEEALLTGILQVYPKSAK